MVWPFHDKEHSRYWLKVFLLYTGVEACIQLLFFVTLNNFGTQRISILEYHMVMLFFQCVLIWPIWWVAWSVKNRNIIVQVLVNVAFYVIYSFVWFGPVQDAISIVYNEFQSITRPPNDRQVAYLDRGYEYSFLNHQLLKHAFRLSWFFLAAYFFNYKKEEKKRLELAIANSELQLKSLKWHLNPSFYFKTIGHLKQLANEKPVYTTGPILQLAKVMEYVIYETKEKLIDVKKELQFLSNYTELINKQPGNNIEFEMAPVNVPEKLRIAPLLLAGIIDKLVDENGKENIHYKVSLHFTGNSLELSIRNKSGSGMKDLLTNTDALSIRLEKLYPGKYTHYKKDENSFILQIKLDEER
jgi:hypothetical protein